MSIKILTGDCRELLKTLPEGSIHTCITSPPYWGLRDYGTAKWEGGDPNCDHSTVRTRGDDIKPGGLQGTSKGSRPDTRKVCGFCGATRVDLQIGQEATPQEFVDNMVQVFREVRRVLRDDGTLWLNLGDSYISGSTGSLSSKPSKMEGGRATQVEGAKRPSKLGMPGLKTKDLVGIPWRTALALQADGWYLRSDIIWHKPNPMPESVTDRPSKAHEYFFLLTKTPEYFYDYKAIVEPWKENPNDIKRAIEKHPGYDGKHTKGYSGAVRGQPVGDPEGGRNKRTIWTVPTHAFSGAHFATFPPDLIEPCIKAGSSEKGCCPKCGAPWHRVIEKSDQPDPSYRGSSFDKGKTGERDGGERTQEGERMLKVSKGWKPSCECGLTEVVPCTVLDPFGGAGTTGLVADRHGRNAILCELNPEYIKLGAERISGDAPLFAQVDTES